MSVTLEKKGNIAILTVNNPPVNAMSHAVRSGLVDHLAAARVDDDVEGIVIACAGRTFIAGADITEFGKPPKDPVLGQLIVALEQVGKPTIAALHGSALGGGLEVSLACQYRVAHRSAKLGLPEVKLGLSPGGGGTVRLPYLMGPLPALDMITKGEPVSADRALELGLVDGLCDADVLEFATSFLREKISAGDDTALVRAQRDKIDITDLSVLDEKIAAVVKKARGLEAPIASAEAVRNAVTMEFDAALTKEREIFERLMAGTQSKAQRHLFFAERAATKVSGVQGAAPRAVETIGIIGSGTMGGGIAMAFANSGFPVTMVDVSDEALARGRQTIEKNYGVSVNRGSLSAEVANERLRLFSYTTEMTDLADCDLIIEAAFEDMDVKKDIFGQLDRIAKPSAILATNTSYLDINEIATAVGRPENMVGLHFFSPANVMRLLEIVRGAKTAPDVLLTAVKIGKKIGKVPVVVGVCPGFVGNRMLGARSADAIDLLLQGATPKQIDRAFTAFGWPMGPFQMWDLAGLDIGWRNRKSLGQTQPVADDLCQNGHFGQKTGRGYYRYEAGSRTPLEDPDVLQLIRDQAKALGITQRVVSTIEVLERTHFPLVNEGARIMAEGIATRWSDIDLVWVNGYGFPKAKGGPMYWAESCGLNKIVERLDYWHVQTGKPVFEPTRILRDAAEAGGSFQADELVSHTGSAS